MATAHANRLHWLGSESRCWKGAYEYVKEINGRILHDQDSWFFDWMRL
jgi:hypothetical protein